MKNSKTARPSGFAHKRLDAYHVALRLFAGVERMTAAFPRGHADLRDQIRRAAAAVVRNIAEGANRRHPADKSSRFLVARGEAGECDACLDMVAILGLASPSTLHSLRSDADRVGAMLTGLAMRERRRTSARAYSSSSSRK